MAPIPEYLLNVTCKLTCKDNWALGTSSTRDILSRLVGRYYLKKEIKNEEEEEKKERVCFMPLNEFSFE